VEVPQDEQNRAFEETCLPQDEQNMERRFYQPNSRKTTTRSRPSSGPPRRKLDVWNVRTQEAAMANPNTQTLIAEAYAAFNRRDIDAALALMSDTVSWPKASEGGRVVGKEKIRAYWTRQWKEFDPHVEPLEMIDRGENKTEVKVHQLVKALNGAALSDSNVSHIYTIANGLIERMDLAESDPSSPQTPSAAFSDR
jgi:hypothetical protein